MLYLHFTTPARARAIVECGYIRPGMLNRKGVWAVPEGGYYLPWLQRWDSRDAGDRDRDVAHQRSKRAAVLFETRKKPYEIDPVQCGWNGRLVFMSACILSITEAKQVLDCRWQRLRPLWGDEAWPQYHDEGAWKEKYEAIRRIIEQEG